MVELITKRIMTTIPIIWFLTREFRVLEYESNEINFGALLRTSRSESTSETSFPKWVLPDIKPETFLSSVHSTNYWATEGIKIKIVYKKYMTNVFVVLCFRFLIVVRRIILYK